MTTIEQVSRTNGAKSATLRPRRSWSATRACRTALALGNPDSSDAGQSCEAGLQRDEDMNDGYNDRGRVLAIFRGCRGSTTTTMPYNPVVARVTPSAAARSAGPNGTGPAAGSAAIQSRSGEVETSTLFQPMTVPTL